VRYEARTHMIPSAFQLNFRRRNALVRALFPLGFLAAGAAISEAGQPGKLAEELWWNISGGTVANLTSNPRFFQPADYVGWISGVEPQRNRANQFGRRLRGLITAPATGNYVFWVSGDDGCEFWLSTDDSITHKRKIAYVDGYTAFQQYNKYPSQQSVSIPLVQGQRYYLEALQVDGGGDDHLSLFWQTPSGVFQVIPASAIESYEANSGAYGSSNTIEGGGATFIFGSDNSAVNQYSGLIAGGGNRVWAPLSGPGDSNVLLGSGNTINPVPAQAGLDVLGSILIGVDNSTSQTQSWAVGLGNIGQTNTVTLGTYNATVPNAALIVGTGTSDTSRSNGLVVLRDGTVQIPSGALQVGGESLPTTTSVTSQISSYLNENGYLKNFSDPAAPWYGASYGALMAMGDSAFASGDGAVAIGYSTYARSNSVAIGDGNWADGDHSSAIGGRGNAANGFCSYALGAASYVSSNQSLAWGYYAGTMYDYSIALGSKNLGSNMDLLVEGWQEDAVLFELGNGTPGGMWSDYDSNRLGLSNAITTLKNGQTTLTNKAWLNREQSVSATADPSPDDTDSSGEALVVEGHTRLKGKVIIEQPQGDISMGIYE